MSQNDYGILNDFLNKNNVVATEEQIGQLDSFYSLLVEQNKVMNLTAITEFNDVLIKHFIDSLAIIPFIKLQECKTLIDIGTGAGFPGIPIKIMFPNIKITLIDSLNKRITFLNNVISECNLKNIEVFHGRAEDFAHQKIYREKYDLCVSRAVANLSVLNEYCLPFVKVGGKFISYKAGHIDEELKKAQKSIAVLGGSLDKINKFQLYQTDFNRTLVMIKKIKGTPDKYPRKSGLPLKNPII